ncbi:MAG: phosphate acyltransferase PlsX [Clostridia bacterium]|nr:phosphate acyltransferase PlsX [Clostridia bacterium]
MRIIVDVMGGDNAPEETVRGVFMAAKEYNASYIMVGNRYDIERIAKEENFDIRRMDIVHTDTVIAMEDDPLCVVRGKQDSSMAIGLKMLAEGYGDAFVSTGNTGALFTGSTLIVRKVKGVLRAGIGAILPLQVPVLLLDTGANLVVTEENLEQFAVMGSAFMRKMYHVNNPRVGLLNNGAEEIKGTELQQAAYKRLSACKEINFVGNVEGSTLPFDSCDVLVADGFTGNICLKSVEGIAKMLLKRLKEVFYSTPATKLAALSMKKQLDEMKHDYDAKEHGGAPILGISKPVIKAHGSSDAVAFKNAIRQAIDYAQSDVIYDIAVAAKEYNERKKLLKEQAAKAAAEAEAEAARAAAAEQAQTNVRG